MDGRARSFTHEAAMNVTYIFDSDEEREGGRSPSRLSGSTAVPGESTQPRAQRDSTYVPAEDEWSDEGLYEGTAPASYQKRPREEVNAGDEGQTARKSARLGGKTGDRAGASPSKTTAASPSNAREVPVPITVSDSEDENREFIYVSSDAEVKPEEDSSPVRKKKKVNLAPRRTLSSVVLPPHKSSKGKEPARKNGNSTPRGEPSVATQVPSWFEDALFGIRRSFPIAKVTVFCRVINGVDRWGVKCLLCDPPKEILVGPGLSLWNFKMHLTGKSTGHGLPQPEMATAERPSSSTTSPHKTVDFASVAAPSGSRVGKEGGCVPPLPKTPKNRKPQVEDVVVRFLKEIGLTSDLADALRRVGISDEPRMKALGQLSDTMLERLDKSLAEEGLDLSARLLILAGLKRRADAA